MLQVEAKYPALLFKQQLDAFVQKIFPMLRDNVKKEITPQLAACIHAPRAVNTRSRRGAPAPHHGDSATSPGALVGPRLPAQHVCRLPAAACSPPTVRLASWQLSASALQAQMGALTGSTP